jgi:hypothetical protein
MRKGKGNRGRHKRRRVDGAEPAVADEDDDSSDAGSDSASVDESAGEE